MSTIKNGHLMLSYHFNKIKKGPGTSFQFPALSQKHIAMPMMTSQILKSVNFTKTPNLDVS